MDGGIIGLIVAIAKSLPDGAVARAETAQEKAEIAQGKAEQAAELAQHYGYGMQVQGHKLIITSEVDD